MINFFDKTQSINNSDFIWYIESTSPEMEGSVQGSAVAIKLYHTGTKPSSAETYLLTCAHNIRGVEQTSNKPYGAILPQIRAWQPGSGYNSTSGVGVEVFEDIKPYIDFDPYIATPKDRQNSASSDWVVLKIKDPDVRETSPSLIQVGIKPKKHLDIFGFSGGSDSFEKSIVNPIKLPGPITYKDRLNAKIILISRQGKPGLSGGGVFNANTNELVGIHRSKVDKTETLQAISAAHIIEKISSQNYAPRTERITNKKNKLIFASMVLSLLIATGYVFTYNFNSKKNINCEIIAKNLYFKKSFKDNQLDTLNQALESYIEQCPSDINANYLNGVYYLANENLPKAETYLKKSIILSTKNNLIKTDPNEFIIDLAYTFYLGKKWDDAIKTYDDVKVGDNSENIYSRKYQGIGKTLLARGVENTDRGKDIESSLFFFVKAEQGVIQNDKKLLHEIHMYKILTELKLTKTDTVNLASITNKFIKLLNESNHVCQILLSDFKKPNLQYKNQLARDISLSYITKNSIEKSCKK